VPIVRPGPHDSVGSSGSRRPLWSSILTPVAAGINGDALSRMRENCCKSRFGRAKRPHESAWVAPAPAKRASETAQAS